MRAFKTSIALLATLGLVACGSDSKSGQQVAPRLDAPVFGGTASLTLPGASEGTPCSLEWVPASGETKLSLSAAACDEKLLYGWYGGLPMTVQSAFSAPAGAVASATGHVECGELTDDVRGTVTDGVASFTWGAPAVQADTACTATLTVTVTAAGKSPSASSVSMPFTLHPAPVAQSLTASPAALTVVNGPAPFTPTSTLTATLLSLKLGSGLSEKASTSSTYAWTDTCGGTFAPADSASPVYTPPASGGATSKTCTIEVTVAVTATDAGETSDPVSSKATAVIVVSYVTGVPVFDAIPAPLPPNIPSVGFQATQTAELGDLVTLAADSGRHANAATVIMSSWALHSDYPTMPAAGFEHPVTLTFYDATTLAPIASITQTFLMSWRPEADPTCSPAWKWKAADGICYSGFAFPITFDLSALNLTLPDTFVYGIAYNTNTWGYAPIGLAGPYESLNVGVLPAAPTVGTDVDPDAVYWNTMIPTNYADGGAGGVGTFRKDTNWSADGAPVVTFFAY